MYLSISRKKIRRQKIKTNKNSGKILHDFDSGHIFPLSYYFERIKNLEQFISSY